MGLDMYWQTLFTEKLISGRVIVAYCKAPTTNMYSVWFSKHVVSCFDNLRLLTIGVEIPLASSIFTLSSKSEMYLV